MAKSFTSAAKAATATAFHGAVAFTAAMFTATLVADAKFAEAMRSAGAITPPPSLATAAGLALDCLMSGGGLIAAVVFGVAIRSVVILFAEGRSHG